MKDWKMGKDNRESFIEKMNRWSASGRPYLFVIDYRFEKPLIIPLEEAASSGLFYKIEHAGKVMTNLNCSSGDHAQTGHDFPAGFDNLNTKNTGRITTKGSDSMISFEKDPVDYSVYKTAFDLVMNEIHKGNSFLTNLTFETPIRTNLSLEEIFLKSEAPYKLFIQGHFVVFSPELFVTIEGGKIKSEPMKGTIDASIPDAETNILNDVKETAEHHTIVDLIRNDLALIATNVKVERFRFITTVKTSEKTLLQVSSTITGDLPADWSSKLGNLFAELLPAGSICGAPKHKTLEIIDKAETYDRGYYSGVFGLFDGENLFSAVMIRYLEKRGHKHYFKSGGGITFMSDAQKEYDELIDKIYVPIY